MDETEGSQMSSIDNTIIENTIKELVKKYGSKNEFRIEHGVKQAASLWMNEDGTAEEFQQFCLNHFINSDEELDKLFNRLQTNMEYIRGYFRKLNLELNKPLALDIGEKLPIDQDFGAYDPSAHFEDDFYKNKIAFQILLNFPYYSLQEKIKLAPSWSRKQWAYARMADIFNSRVPAELNQKISKCLTDADSYISEYNIYMGNLIDKSGISYFPADMKLISHWGLRDELKSHYGEPDGLVKQNLIYDVMKRIISQEIPEMVINNDSVKWDPVENKVLKNGKEIEFKQEPNTRYKYLLDNFKAMKAVDPYCPYYPTYIKRKFEQEFEIPQEKVYDMFVKFISSPTMKKVGELISKRLGRKLEPFDIWYDGFKARSSISQEQLTATTKAKYPTRESFQKELPVILSKLGFSPEKTAFISSKVQVDPSRGAGHASGAEMKSDISNLRTRVGKDGMDYKGYNIAIHEFGHNVEQTISLQDIDYYMLAGVPNTAFTEAWAFVFQKRDLELLGLKETNPDKDYLMTLDNCWSAFEIMGVSIVDMEVWKWLYANPDATPEQLKESVIKIAKDVWNKYYAPIFGVKDEPILAIYSHMIDYPLYLSAYPIGHLIEFQLEKFLAGKNLGTEMERIIKQGSILPDEWMKGAVGNVLSIEPTLESTEEALKHIK
ncbi:MAG: hypothetical protein EPN82_04110 [Bacteroidetes bacterium]|nr:MAG: hypothetical protein EPN82_04110 [Bacteroidota bacterium]